MSPVVVVYPRKSYCATFWRTWRFPTAPSASLKFVCKQRRSAKARTLNPFFFVSSPPSSFLNLCLQVESLLCVVAFADSWNSPNKKKDHRRESLSSGAHTGSRAGPCPVPVEGSAPENSLWAKTKTAIMAPFITSAPRTRRVVAVLGLVLLACVLLVVGFVRRPEGERDVLSYVDPLIGTVNGGARQTHRPAPSNSCSQTRLTLEQDMFSLARPCHMVCYF